MHKTASTCNNVLKSGTVCIYKNLDLARCVFEKIKQIGISSTNIVRFAKPFVVRSKIILENR